MFPECLVLVDMLRSITTVVLLSYYSKLERQSLPYVLERASLTTARFTAVLSSLQLLNQEVNKSNLTKGLCIECALRLETSTEMGTA